MHLHELYGWQGPMTLRQEEAWHAWLHMQWNKPSRTDYYLMAVRAALLQKGTNLRDLRINFIDQQPDGTPVRTPEQEAFAVQQSKARWLIAAGMPVKEVPFSAHETYGKHDKRPEQK